MELMMLAERLPAKVALEWGLVNRVVPDASLEDEARAIAERLANGASSLKTIRTLVGDAVDSDWQVALAAERVAQLGAGRSADFQEGVAAFKGKRPPRFGG